MRLKKAICTILLSLRGVASSAYCMKAVLPRGMRYSCPPATCLRGGRPQRRERLTVTCDASRRGVANGQVLTRSVSTCTLMRWTDTRSWGSWGGLQRAELELASYILCSALVLGSEPAACRANLRMTSWPTIHRHMAWHIRAQSGTACYMALRTSRYTQSCHRLKVSETEA